MILIANAIRNYTLYAGNKCGHSSSQIKVYTGKKVMDVVMDMQLAIIIWLDFNVISCLAMFTFSWKL